MNRRIYGHVCAIAHALDLVGERWTLLLVRELIFGPRRYSDLLRELPGLGTNLLAQRLKDLEQAGLITHTKLPPPAASSVYTLTAAGREGLLPVIRSLANLGLSYLRYPPLPEDFTPVSSTMGALSTFFQPQRATGFSAAVEFHTGEDVFHCTIANGELTEVGFGSLRRPTLVVHGTTALFMGLVVGYIKVADALAVTELQIAQGDEATATAFFALFEGPYAGFKKAK